MLYSVYFQSRAAFRLPPWSTNLQLFADGLSPVTPVFRVLYLEDAVDDAVESCIRDNILSDFLKAHRAEVKEIMLTEYDEKFHIAQEKKISREKGREEGRAEGLELGVKRGLEQGLTRGVAQSVLQLLEDILEVPEDLKCKIHIFCASN